MLVGMGPDPYMALAAELNVLGRRLDALGGELVRLRAADGGGGVPGTEGFPGAPGSSVPPVGAAVPPAAHPPTGAWVRGGPAQAPAGPEGGPRAPRSQMSGARVLAWTGG